MTDLRGQRPMPGARCPALPLASASGEGCLLAPFPHTQEEGQKPGEQHGHEGAGNGAESKPKTRISGGHTNHHAKHHGDARARGGPACDQLVCYPAPGQAPAAGALSQAGAGMSAVRASRFA